MEEGRTTEEQAERVARDQREREQAHAQFLLEQEMLSLREERMQLKQQLEVQKIVRQLFVQPQCARLNDQPGDLKKDKAEAACLSVWGGPVMPHECDTVWEWIGDFFGGYTTAHGINRVYDDNQGPLRRGFWCMIFLSSFYFLWLMMEKAVAAYLAAEVQVSLFSEEASTGFPMVSVCSYSPIRCRCEVYKTVLLFVNSCDVSLLQMVATPRSLFRFSMRALVVVGHKL